MNALLSRRGDKSFYATQGLCQMIKNSTATHYKEGITFYEKLWEIIDKIGNEILIVNNDSFISHVSLNNNYDCPVQVKWEKDTGNVFIALAI